MNVTTTQTVQAMFRTRKIRCPHCGHCVIRVYDNTQGWVQAKCKGCGQETVFEVKRTVG